MKPATKDMTRGGITRHLTSFAVPLVLGNLFQLTYNAVDSIVVGRFAGTEALAAVGAADPVMNLLILGVTGLCIGASVLMSFYFGAGDGDMLKRELGTTLLMGGALSLMVLTLGLLFSKPLLVALSVPESILPLSLCYLRVILMGMPFTCLYNVYASALRSVGDSATPIRYLMIASVLNVGLDLLAVAALSMGVLGAALATDVAQGVSALLCALRVRRRVPALRLGREHLRLDAGLMRRTLQYGGMTALQQCSQPVGKLLIQSAINTLGVSVIAAFNAVGKIEDFALVPGRSIANAMMTFTAQNRGAKQPARIRQGFFKGMALEAAYWVLIGTVILLLDRPMLSLFSNDGLTLGEGSRYFALMAYCYWLPGVTNGIQGFFRGMGKMSVTLYGTLTQISLRVLFSFLLVPRMGITGVALACVIGWLAMLLWEGVYCRWFMRNRLVT